MRIKLPAAYCLFTVTLAAAASFSTAAPAAAQDWSAREVPVMTRNLYFGTSLDGVLMSTSMPQLIVEVTQAWQAVLATNFPERAEALADEIASQQPWLVGLQEAALWRIQSPGDLLFGGTVPATQVVYDYTQILLDELAERGMRYEIVASLDHLDAELPTLAGDDVRLTDRDVVLARTDLPPGLFRVVGTESGHFNNLLQVPVAGGPSSITVFRGWVAADVWMHGRSFRFVNTHLETESFPQLQHAQTMELIGLLSTVDTPVVLVGDFNSDAGGTTTASYSMLLTAGFVDAWTEVHPTLPGLTWGHDAGLRNASVNFSQRIDLVYYRGRFQVTGGTVLGDELGDRTPSGLWPSDHAGVAIGLSLFGRR